MGSDSLLTALLSSSPDGLVLVSPDGRLLAWNDRLLELFDFSEEERERMRTLGPGRPAQDALVAGLQGRVLGEYVSIGQNDAVTVIDLTLTDGRILERHASTWGDGPGRIRLGVFRDVTHRRMADAELRRRASEQAALARLTDEALGGNDLDRLLARACKAAVDLLGYEAVAVTDVRGEAWTLRAAAGVAAPPLGRVEPAADRGITGAFGFVDAHEIALPGSERTLRVLGAYSTDSHVFGHDEVRILEAIAGVLTAALARYRAEEALSERELQLRAIFDAPLDAMLVVGGDGRVVDVNPAACELLGKRREALVERPLDDAVPALGPRGPERWSERRAQGRASGEVELAVPSGRRLAEYAAVAGIRPGRDLVVLRDVTERKQMGARLALADRMASVGTLAAGVAHELNNPLAYVSANLAFLADRVARTGALLMGSPPDPDDHDLAAQLAEAVRDARDGCERMRVIIRDLKTFSRPDDEHTGPVDLCRVLDSAVNMAWNEIKHRARLVKELTGLPPVHGNEGRLGQVFLNLLVNAAQALPEGRADANTIRVSGEVLADGRVAVDVTDTGCGVPAELAGRIFDPFFTTKAPGVGTGLGLSICHSIVSALGGEIQVRSTPGEGSTFRVVLRAAAPASLRREPAPAPQAVPRARILVVDDEALVGTVLARTLRGDHDVQVVTSARAALDKVEQGERFDVVLSDLLMPEMTGMDLYAELQKRDPGYVRRMVFLTGGAFTPAAREFLEETKVVCLEKPFEVGALRATLAAKLAEAA
ncbi:MAG: ATP-binding protein [Anaeromyxobacteraceae bacterium]